ASAALPRTGHHRGRDRPAAGRCRHQPGPAAAPGQPYGRTRHFMRIRRLCAVTVVLGGAVSLVACGGQRQANSGDKPGGRLTIATGNTTGVYYQLGGALASLISSKVEGYRATASETGASVQNVQGLTAGNYDIAFSLGDTAADAVKGQHSFKTPQDVVALTRLYPNYTQVAVRAAS